MIFKVKNLDIEISSNLQLVVQQKEEHKKYIDKKNLEIERLKAQLESETQKHQLFNQNVDELEN